MRLEDKMIESLEEDKNEHEEATTIELQRSGFHTLSLHGGEGSSREEDIPKVKENAVETGGGARSALEEMEQLRNEWKLATEAEEKTRRAMEDLAFALKEVVTEANHTKEKLRLKKDELEEARSEVQRMKEILLSTEERYQNLLHEAREEAVLNKNMADRLRLEADEALLAWNEKEVGFVSCIKRAEEEKAVAQHDCRRLGESLKAAEDAAMAAREEMSKSRDIMKQAINEADATKSTARIARDEKSFLKGCIADKEQTLHSLTKENERLRDSEAAAQEKITRLKFLLSTISAGNKDKHHGELDMLTSDVDAERNAMSRGLKKTFSFTLDDIHFLNDPGDEIASHEEEPTLKCPVETMKSETRTPLSIFTYHQRRHSHVVSDGGNTPNWKDVEHSYRRMRKMFRRVGNLHLSIRRVLHFQKNDASTGSVITTNASIEK